MSISTQHSIPAAAGRMIFGWIVVVVAVVVCTVLLQTTAFRGIGIAVYVTAGLAVVCWTLLARSQWWAIVPVAYSFGGVMYFGFKIYTHEIALALAVMALLPHLVVADVLSLRRKPISPLLYLLLVYILLHLCMSEYLCIRERTGGAGNILRVYVQALWPIIFVVFFFRYGSTKYLKYVLMAMYVASVIRVAFGLVGCFTRGVFYIPFLNYIPSGTATAGADLRVSALLLVSISLCYSSMAKSRIVSVLHLFMLVPAGWLILIGGGRVSLVAFCVMIIIWALIQRKFVFLGSVSAALVLSVAALNQDPTLINNADPRIQRTLSIVILKNPTTSIHQLVAGSNLWHEELTRLGRVRWLESSISAMVGNRVERYDETVARNWVSLPVRAELAARQGAYESGLWTVLAVLGIIGAVLYVSVFHDLLKGVVPDLVGFGVRDCASAFSFIALTGVLLWLAFSWIYGHFPSHELAMAAVARAAFEDTRRAAAGPATPPQGDGRRTR